MYHIFILSTGPGRYCTEGLNKYFNIFIHETNDCGKSCWELSSYCLIYHNKNKTKIESTDRVSQKKWSLSSIQCFQK